MAILVCGRAGYIGSHVNKQLHSEGYETIVFDNLVYGHKEAIKWGHFEQGDLKNISDIEHVFQKYDIDAVFHFAAYAYVGDPAMLVGSSGKARQALGWEPVYGDIDTIVSHAWNWHEHAEY